MTTIVNMQDVNQFPTGKNRWESYTTDKEVSYEIRRVLPNEIFGHQEVIEALQREKDSEIYPELKLKDPITRYTTIKALAPSSVIMLNKQFFLDCKCVLNVVNVCSFRSEANPENEGELDLY